jgi:hypothetical protein
VAEAYYKSPRQRATVRARMNYIEAVRTIASRFLEDSNQSVSHRADHIERVLSTAHQISQSFFDVDREILTLSVLLHDVDQPFNDKKNHVQLSERRAKDILAALRLPVRLTGTSVDSILLAVLKRDRVVVALVLGSLTILSWTYLICMNWGMHRMDVGMQMFIMPAMEHWTTWDLVLVFLMWAIMMVAMMVPTSSPMILLFATINRRHHKPEGEFVATGLFLLGYLTAWTTFSVLATLAQWGLLTAALVSPMMQSTSNSFGAGLLLIAALFQLSRLKYSCLAHCRSPIGFLPPSGETAYGVRIGWG